MNLPRSTLYRHRTPRLCQARPAPAWSLSETERQQAFHLLHQERFIDLSVAEIYATLLDEGIYIASIRTLQRLLSSQQELTERRALRRHPTYQKPELLATRPNEVWSWDISKLRGPQKGTWFQLYVVLDIFSRAVVGWLVATKECERLASDLIEQSCDQQGIVRGQLTLHADRGPAMRSQCLASRLSELGVHKSHSRPYVSNDNAYSESQFKTMKYHAGYPDRFGSIEHAKGWLRGFFKWYNEEHHHQGLALLTPRQVHTGEGARILARRQEVLDRAYEAHPERFSRAPKVQQPPTEAWLCRPKETTEEGKNEKNERSSPKLAMPDETLDERAEAGEGRAPCTSPMGAEGVDDLAGASRQGSAERDFFF